MRGPWFLSPPAELFWLISRSLSGHYNINFFSKYICINKLHIYIWIQKISTGFGGFLWRSMTITCEPLNFPYFMQFCLLQSAINSSLSMCQWGELRGRRETATISPASLNFPMFLFPVISLVIFVSHIFCLHSLGDNPFASPR